MGDGHGDAAGGRWNQARAYQEPGVRWRTSCRCAPSCCRTDIPPRLLIFPSHLLPIIAGPIAHCARNPRPWRTADGQKASRSCTTLQHSRAARGAALPPPPVWRCL
ncbi:hypothetical protein GWL_39760 [Herbaspirillum sp. GW103]|nr:hypothetical protein GWL_39760 [Herbaspirillum sp. GW103]